MIRLYDFFDTIAHRRCTSDEIKRIWSQMMVERLGIPWELERLYGIRRREEIYLAKNKKPYGEFSYAELCGRIYESLIYAPDAYDKISDLSENEFIDICIDEELKTELKYQYTDENLVKEIESAKKNGDKIYIVSDFYLGKEMFNKFLAHHKINTLFDGIFVSCDSGFNKYSGTLYQYVIESIGVDCKDCVMTGDNYRADFIMAQKAGIKAIHTAYKADSESITNTAKRNILAIEKRFRKEYGNYANYGIQLFLFADRLYKSLKQKQHSKVYFFSREGEFIKTLFDAYLDIKGIEDIETKYLYVSRKATFVPSLRSLEDEDFDIIFREYPDISLSGFVKNLGFSEENIADIAGSSGLDFESVIKDLSKSEQLMELKQNERFIDLYNSRRCNQSEAFRKYLEQEGISNASGRIAVVDVGWKGTIQDNIYRFFGGEVEIDGYYIGLHSGGDTQKGNYKYGLLFSVLPDESYMYEEMSWGKTWYERLMYASHASADSYDICNDIASPSLKSFESEKNIYEAVKPIQACVTECFKEVCRLFRDLYCPNELIRDVFIEIYLRVLFKEKTSFLKLQNMLLSNQFENFGFNTSQAEVERERFKLSNMWRKRAVIAKAIKEFGRTNSVGTICHVLELKKLYFLSQILYRYVYHVRKKKFERLKAYEKNGKYYSPRL